MNIYWHLYVVLIPLSTALLLNFVFVLSAVIYTDTSIWRSCAKYEGDFVFCKMVPGCSIENYF